MTVGGTSMDPQRPLRAAVVQDSRDGRVLMVGWLDDEALAATLRTGFVHFHSRSRDRLWRKGETSGNTLPVRAIEVDCDGDTYLIQADPAGPTCHTGDRSCFDAGLMDLEGSRTTRSTTVPLDEGFEQLEALWATIGARRSADPASSYTARLLAGGVDAVGRKVVEEATEVLMAAKDDAATDDAATAAASPRPDAANPSRTATRGQLAEESADLLYHLLVLLAQRGVAPREVLALLRQRSRSTVLPDAEQDTR